MARALRSLLISGGSGGGASRCSHWSIISGRINNNSVSSSSSSSSSSIPIRTWCNFHTHQQGGNGFTKTLLLQQPTQLLHKISRRHLIRLAPASSSSTSHLIYRQPIHNSFVYENRAYFHSSLPALQDNKDNVDKTETPKFGEQMTLRLINENGFLSWTRNSYLSAAVGVAMLNSAEQDLMQPAGVLVLLVSAMNMAWGSASHFANLVRIRQRIVMSKPTLFLNMLGTVVHALLWLLILGYYLSFSRHTRKQKLQGPSDKHHCHDHHQHHTAKADDHKE